MSARMAGQTSPGSSKVGNVARQQAARHEVALPCGQAVANLLGCPGQVDEHHAGARPVEHLSV